jgi:hypothetical protein
MDRDEEVIEGRAFIGEELHESPVAITVRKGIIRKIQEIHPRNLPWITPALFNAHTHIADGVAMDIPLTGPLEDIVAPPSGLKHRIRNRPRGDLVRGMRATISQWKRQAPGFADFREGRLGVRPPCSNRSVLQPGHLRGRGRACRGGCRHQQCRDSRT